MRLLVDVNYTQLLFPNRTTNVPFAFQIHEKIMKALIQVYGEEEANKINEEWIGCSSEIEIENEIVIFKEALYLGYDLADVFFNRR